jgi:hypothetical protein
MCGSVSNTLMSSRISIEVPMTSWLFGADRARPSVTMGGVSLWLGDFGGGGADSAPASVPKITNALGLKAATDTILLPGRFPTVYASSPGTSDNSRDPREVGRFAYDGGHMRHHASAARGLGIAESIPSNALLHVIEFPITDARYLEQKGHFCTADSVSDRPTGATTLGRTGLAGADS